MHIGRVRIGPACQCHVVSLLFVCIGFLVEHGHNNSTLGDYNYNDTKFNKKTFWQSRENSQFSEVKEFACISEITELKKKVLQFLADQWIMIEEQYDNL